MIEREYYSLIDAPAKFSCTAEDLLALALSGKIRLFVSLASPLGKLMHKDGQPASDKSTFIKDRFGVVYKNDVHKYDRARIDSKSCVIHTVMVPDDPEDRYWDINNGFIPMDDKYLFVSTEEIKSLRNDATNLQDTVIKNNNAYMSDDLKILIQAATRFWGVVDPKHKDTHPKNVDVRDWLIKQGFSEVSATQGATIIRPKYAKSGGRPKR